MGAWFKFSVSDDVMEKIKAAAGGKGKDRDALEAFVRASVNQSISDLLSGNQPKKDRKKDKAEVKEEAKPIVPDKAWVTGLTAGTGAQLTM